MSRQRTSTRAKHQLPLIKLTAAENDAFWAIVNDIGWCDAQRRKARRGGSPSLAQAAANQLSPGAREMMFDIAINKAIALKDRYTAWCARHGIDVGAVNLPEDQFGDLTVHVVGCGREVYAANMRNPGLLFRRSRAMDFETSFTYLFV